MSESESDTSSQSVKTTRRVRIDVWSRTAPSVSSRVVQVTLDCTQLGLSPGIPDSSVLDIIILRLSEAPGITVEVG